jgi:hypothetical protein
MTLGRLAQLALLALIALLAVPATASAVDLRGKWECCGSGGAGRQNFVITTMSASGAFSGHADYPTGATFSPIRGTTSGNSVSLTTGPYTGSSYSATFTGTIAADGKTMSGSWRSNANQSGTWTATRVSGPPTTTPRPAPPPPPCIGSAATCQGLGLYVGNPQLNPNQVGPFLFGCVDRSGTRAQTNCTYGTAIEYPEAEFILLTRGPAQNNLDNNLVPGIFTDTRSRLLRSPFGAQAARRTRLLVLARSTVVVARGRSRNLKLNLRAKAHRLFVAARQRGVRGVTHATLRVTLNGSTVRSRRIPIRVG